MPVIYRLHPSLHERLRRTIADWLQGLKRQATVTTQATQAAAPAVARAADAASEVETSPPRPRRFGRRPGAPIGWIRFEGQILGEPPEQEDWR